VIRRSIKLNKHCKPNANTAAGGIAPANMVCVSFTAKPDSMRSAKPPSPTKLAKAAVPRLTTCRGHVSSFDFSALASRLNAYVRFKELTSRQL
jgi:hypothetical protein